MGTLDGADDSAVDQAAQQLDEEERELWRQLRRKRDFEVRILEKRAQIEELQKKRQSVRLAQAQASASVEVLTKEVEFVKSQQRELEHDLAVLKESNRLLQQAFQLQTGSKPHSIGEKVLPPRTKDTLAEERAHMESLQAQQDQIGHLQKHIESMHVEKQNLQQQQEVLFQKQRTAEQDQNRLLGAIQDDRNLLNEVRSERIKLFEERAILEKQMASVVSKVHEGVPREERTRWSPRTSPSEQVAQSLKPPGSFGGVRGHVPQDPPLPQPSPFFSSPLQDRRPHWISFQKDGDAASRLNQAVESPSFGGHKFLQTT
ncbi:unnamed protein product [Durusdinium trenchii]|uniref:Uncharacterized protein n=2 Tax=Durusdinium trenchii TaxID=1381693 RepID=A0ABP0JJV4_9DINO